MSELRDILEESVDRALAAGVDRAAQQAMAAGAMPDTLAGSVAALALGRALLPEAAGGAGCDWTDIGAILQAAGRRAAPLPIAEEILGRWLLHQAGLEQPHGLVTIAPDAGEIVLGNDGKLTGRLPGVPWGRHAELVLVEVAGADGRRLYAISRQSATLTPDSNLAGEPRDHLDLQNVSPVASGPAAACSIRELGATLRAAAIAGALRRALELSVTYARDRVQFGKPLAAFQAIQQQLAILAEETVAAGMAAASACAALDGGAGPTWAAIAKIRTGEAAAAGAAIAHQVHGAMGFTREHEVHLVTTRLMSWRTELGGEAEWSARLGAQAAAGGGLWEQVVDWGRAVGPA